MDLCRWYRLNKLVKNENYRPIGEIYRDAIIEKRAPLIRQSTPISQIDDRDLPSPRNKSITEIKNSEKDHKISEELFRKYYKPLDFKEIVGQELETTTKKVLKKPQPLNTFSKTERTLEQISKDIKLENIISKAKGRANNKKSKITLSHLSPKRLGSSTQLKQNKSDVKIDFFIKKNTKTVLRKYASIFVIP